MTVPQHTVKAFETELRELDQTIVRMGGMVEAQLADAISALMRRDSSAAEHVVGNDRRIDVINQEIEAAVVRLLALRQPMADDLRAVIAALRIAGDLERIGDYAANIAKRTIAINQAPPVRPAAGIPRMGRLVQQLIKDTLDAYTDRDADKAEITRRRDEEVDEMYTSLFRELLTYMMEDPRNITPCIHILFIAKNIERMGDHATNIAELVYFMATGRSLGEARPKGDTTSLTMFDQAGLDLTNRDGEQSGSSDDR